MEVWSHDGKLYEVNSFYSLPDEGWQYELVGLSGHPGTGPCLAVVVLDATPGDGPFTPVPADHAFVHAGGGCLPWPILHRLIGLIDASGDLVEEQRDLPTEEIPFRLSHDVWHHGSRTFEVNSFHYSQYDSWCYEMCNGAPDTGTNNYLDVKIPDTSPDEGPFTPGPASNVQMTMHGDWIFPWPVFRRFIDLIEASGDIVEGVT